MKGFFAAAGLAAGASAAVVARDQCCFGLTAAGGVSGPVGQLSDGQNRVGGGHPSGTYCIDNGGITDGQGRGCILTPPTTQFQCDVGAKPTTGFSVGPNGQVEYNGSTTFYACPASASEYNIYTTPVAGQTKCVKITLSSGGKCVGTGGSSSSSKAATTSSARSSTSVSSSKPATTSASSSKPVTSSASSSKVSSSASSSKPATSASSSKPATTSASSSKPASSSSAATSHASSSAPASSSKPATGTTPAASGSACQTSLSGAYQTPHLIVPVSSSQPNKAYGTQYNATISPNECTIFNFDIPQSYAGKKCSAVFLFPQQSQLQTSAYTFSGSGDIVFSELSSAANQQTTWNNAPSKKSQLADIAVKPGNSYVVTTQACEAGKTESIELCSKNGLSLEFFEDYNPSPIGLYITSC